MARDVPSDLTACDVPLNGTQAAVAIETHGTRGYRMTAIWPKVELVRTLEITGGLVRWREPWTKTSAAMVGLPFRHRLFLREGPARFRLSGNPDVGSLAGCAMNPTAFLGSREHPGNGMGVTAESDWLRLVMWARRQVGVGEVYSESLALAPGSRIDFALTIAPLTDGGSHWSFISGVRRRSGMNGHCVQRHAVPQSILQSCTPWRLRPLGRILGGPGRRGQRRPAEIG